MLAPPRAHRERPAPPTASGRNRPKFSARNTAGSPRPIIQPGSHPTSDAARKPPVTCQTRPGRGHDSDRQAAGRARQRRPPTAHTANSSETKAKVCRCTSGRVPQSSPSTHDGSARLAAQQPAPPAPEQQQARRAAPAGTRAAARTASGRGSSTRPRPGSPTSRRSRRCRNPARPPAKRKPGDGEGAAPAPKRERRRAGAPASAHRRKHERQRHAELHEDRRQQVDAERIAQALAGEDRVLAARRRAAGHVPHVRPVQRQVAVVVAAAASAARRRARRRASRTGGGRRRAKAASAIVSRPTDRAREALGAATRAPRAPPRATPVSSDATRDPGSQRAREHRQKGRGPGGRGRAARPPPPAGHVASISTARPQRVHSATGLHRRSHRLSTVRAQPGRTGLPQRSAPSRPARRPLTRSRRESAADGRPGRPVARRTARTTARATASAASAPTSERRLFERQRARREREQRVAVPRRVHRPDRARQAVVRHLRDLGRLRLRQRDVRRHDADRRVLAAERLAGHRAREQRVDAAPEAPVRAARARDRRARLRVDDVAERVHGHERGDHGAVRAAQRGGAEAALHRTARSRTACRPWLRRRRRRCPPRRGRVDAARAAS